ncbi:MAG: PLP-dependent aminotransferase family protein [Candidatus Binatia bacterium]
MDVPGFVAAFSLDRRRGAPLQEQLYRALREAILGGRLRPGTRLPPTRALAADLAVGRNTVVAVFEQLVDEGYLDARVGFGTSVAALPPEALLQIRPTASQKRTKGARPTLAGRGRALAEVRRPVAPMTTRAFQAGLPALDAFPTQTWARMLARRARTPTATSLGYGYAAGFPALREAIAAYAGAARGVRCRPEQVIVTAGAQAGLDFVSRLLLDPGDRAWIEEPGYLGARGALLAANATLVPVSLDADGIDVEAGARRAADARLAYTTPSRQFPTGVTMSLARRLELIEWAARAGAWILEDDYESEYRYGGRPIPSMQGIDASGRVVYVGTFSKTMFPALRVGYLVVPESLVGAFETAIRHTGHGAAVVVQAALADFLTEGHFARHVRRMRALYAKRQARLVEAARRMLGGLAVVHPADAGMHVNAELPRGTDDGAVAAAAAELGVVVRTFSSHCLERPKRGGLLLGYAGVPEPEIEPAVAKLAQALERARPRRRRRASSPPRSRP